MLNKNMTYYLLRVVGNEPHKGVELKKYWGIFRIRKKEAP